MFTVTAALSTLKLTVSLTTPSSSSSMVCGPLRSFVVSKLYVMPVTTGDKSAADKSKTKPITGGTEKVGLEGGLPSPMT
jgi:hypothetical protein